MPTQILTPWLYRRWRFDCPAELHPAVIERLRGLPARTEELVQTLRPGQATAAHASGWTIQRHIAHLADLEKLMAQRLDAYETHAPVLPAADMQNTATIEANHEDRSLEDVLRDVRASRMATVARLVAYPPDFFGRSAWHERLGVQKRVVDSCVFFADHDDHHLALAEIIRRTL